MRLIPLAGLVAATLVTVTSAASAAIVVEVGNSGRGCYEATLTTPSLENNRSAVLACDLAVNTAAGEQARLAAFVNRSDIRLRVQDWAGAVSDAERAIAIDPDDIVAQYNLACVYSVLGDVDEAMVLLERLLVRSSIYHIKWFDNDSDLDNVRTHPRFIRLREIAQQEEAAHPRISKNTDSTADDSGTPAL